MKVGYLKGWVYVSGMRISGKDLGFENEGMGEGSCAEVASEVGGCCGLRFWIWAKVEGQG